MKTIDIQNGKLSASISSEGACIKELRYDGVLVGKDGITIDRYANRIAGSRFTLLGNTYTLAANEGPNCLHGGPGGFSKKEWTAEKTGPSEAVFSIVSEDGDQGFPGKVRVTVSFTITEDDELRICYQAETDAPTVINLTNHMYFTMGEEKAQDHVLKINADFITEADAALLPTGRLADVTGTRWDFREPVPFVPYYDDNFVIRGEGFREATVLKGKDSGITMSVFTDQPAMQLYDTDTHICLETQHFPDSPNHPEFPDTTLLPEVGFRTTTVYAFSR
ncbi:MAG: galactose mutarotase [Firmicutes bacterium]|nr:galactose mutarotase [Bacillota bacterium]